MIKGLKELRKKKYLTQRQVAEKIGVSQPNYLAMENGSTDIGISKIYMLAELFDVSVSELLHLENDTMHQNTITQTQENNNNRVEELEKEIKNLKKELEDKNEKIEFLQDIRRNKENDLDEMKHFFENYIIEITYKDFRSFYGGKMPLEHIAPFEDIYDYIYFFYKDLFTLYELEAKKFKIFGFDFSEKYLENIEKKIRTERKNELSIMRFIGTGTTKESFLENLKKGYKYNDFYVYEKKELKFMWEWVMQIVDELEMGT